MTFPRLDVKIARKGSIIEIVDTEACVTFHPKDKDKTQQMLIKAILRLERDLSESEEELEFVERSIDIQLTQIYKEYSEIKSSLVLERTPSSGESKAIQVLENVRKSIADVFVDQDLSPHVAINVDDHIEIWPLSGPKFRIWISGVCFKELGSTLGSDEAAGIINILKSEALFSKNKRHLFLRVGGDGQDSIYYDIGDDQWQQIRVTKNGWEIIPNGECLFSRPNHQRAQTYPSRDYDPKVFDRFIGLLNIRTEEERILLKSYIIALYVPEIPKPILHPSGEQGSSKSTSQELVRLLVDPGALDTLTIPNDVPQLVQMLAHNYVSFFDNVSQISETISDILCRAVTGLGFSKRQLYTDDSDVVYNFRRCIGLNGINIAATKPDILDRCLIIQLERIPREKRRKRSEILEEFENIRSQVLGYIFDILVKVLKRRKNFSLKEHPRMADFAEVAELISQCMGYPENAFLSAYEENIGLQTEEAIQASPVALILKKFMETQDQWCGSVSELYSRLEEVAPQVGINPSKLKAWPKAPHALSRKINEVRTNLREIGIEIQRPTDTRTNTLLVDIRKIPPVAPGDPTNLETFMNDTNNPGAIDAEGKMPPDKAPDRDIMG